MWRHRAGDIRGKVVFFAYFGLMEVLQSLAYVVIDDCASLANRILTALSWQVNLLSFFFFFLEIAREEFFSSSSASRVPGESVNGKQSEN